MGYPRSNVSLPPAFSSLAGKINYVHQQSRTELHSSCPKCGGTVHSDGSPPDRFIMFLVGKPRAFCRRCGYLWFPDMEKRGWKPDEELMRKWQSEREEQARQEKARAERALQLLQEEKRWMEYHQNLSLDIHREWWRKQGVPDSWQDYWKLGYTPERMYEHNGTMYTSPAYTIPKFGPGWKETNIDFRLVKPVEGVGKYRPIANLPAAPFIALPNDRIGDEVVIVEGSKKAMVVCLYTGYDRKPVQCIGVPGCSSWAGVEKMVEGVGRVWIVLDPDARHWANRLGLAIGEAARIVELPAKPDDAILSYGLTRGLWRHMLRQAVKPVACV